jgi:hypothetical protein
MTLLSRFLPSSIFDGGVQVQRRLSRLETSNRCLEMALDAVLFSPKYVPSAEAGFNGQVFRKRMFGDILSAAPLEAIAETGTCLGDTTAYMAVTSQLPVHTCDLNPRFHAIAKTRLSDFDDIHLNLVDSRRFLRESARGPLADKFTFFYLDAHWYDDLPLPQEIDIIASEWNQFIVMVDDFQVPFDTGYRYDDYGKEKALTMNMLRPLLRQHSLVPFFPAIAADQETGAKRGSVVITRRGENADILAEVPSLRMWAG